MQINNRLASPLLLVLLVCALCTQAAPPAGPTTRPGLADYDPAHFASAPATQPTTLPAATPRPAPQAAALEDVRQRVRDILRRDFRIDPAARLDLARRFIIDAANTTDDPLRFALLREARDLAASASDTHLALSAASDLARHFQVNESDELAETLTAASRSARTPQATIAAAELTMHYLDRAAHSRDFPLALRLAPLAESLAAQLQSEPLLDRARAITWDLQTRHRNALAVEAASPAARAATPDPASAEIVAWDLWTEHDDPAAALPLLAHAADLSLRNLAKRDLESPKDAPSRFALAESWWKAAQNRPPTQRLRLQTRSAHWHRSALPDLQAADKATAQQRIAEASKVLPTVAFIRAITVADPATAAAARQAIANTPTQPLNGVSIDNDITFKASAKPSALGPPFFVPTRGDKWVTITLEPGVEWRGGNMSLAQRGNFRLKGAPDKPIILRNVLIEQDLGGSLDAEHVIFDQCTFAKGGAWFAYHSSKWTMRNCILYKCKFKALTGVDYGFDLRNCSFVSMEFPEIAHKREGKFDHMSHLRKDWNRLISCDFTDCQVPPTVFWCSEKSNFLSCRFIAGEAYESDQELTAEAFVATPDADAPSPQPIWDSKPPLRKPVRFSPATKPFSAGTRAGFEAIPEINVAVRVVVTGS